MSRLSLLFSAAVITLASLLTAAVPERMNYQGRVRASGGGPVADGSYGLQVLIYNVATGGTALWSETYAGVPVTDGLFNVVLGSPTALNLPFDEPYWLAVNFNNDGEMSPRTQLTAAPYAFRAGTVQVPLSLTGTTSSTLYVENTGSESSLRAHSSGTGYGVHASASSALGSAVRAINNSGNALNAQSTSTSGSFVIWGQATGLGGSTSGVVGDTQSFTGNGVMGRSNNAAATGGAGVYGRANAAAVPGVRAENMAGGLALRSIGDAVFDGAGNTATFNTYVSFTAGTNLALGPTPPVQWSAPAAHPLGVLTATNTGSGFGLLGYATAPGIDLGGPVLFGDVLTAGVHGYTSASMSAGVIGRSSAPGQDNVGVLGMGLQGAGVIGKSFGSGRGGEFESAGGTGVVGLGVTGVAASTEVAGGLALLADQGTGARAMQVLGDARFDPKFGSASVSFTTHVDFSGANVTGLAPVSAPLSLTLSSVAASPLSVSNASGAAGVFQGLTGVVVSGTRMGISVSTGTLAESALWAEANNAFQSFGGAVVGLNYNSGAGIYGYSFGTAIRGDGSSRGVYGTASHFAGTGLHGQATGASAIGVAGVGGAIGVSGNANNAASGVGGHFQGATAVVATSTLASGRALRAINADTAPNGVAIEATAVGMSGVGVLARAPQGAGSSMGVVAEGGFIGVSAVGGAGSGAGVYASGFMALDADGILNVRGKAAPGVAAAGQGRIVFDSSLNRFRVSESGGAFVDLVSGGVSAPLSLTGTGSGSALYVSHAAGTAAALYSGTGRALSISVQGAGTNAIHVATGATGSHRAIQVDIHSGNNHSMGLLAQSASAPYSSLPSGPLGYFGVVGSSNDTHGVGVVAQATGNGSGSYALVAHAGFQGITVTSAGTSSAAYGLASSLNASGGHAIIANNYNAGGRGIRTVAGLVGLSSTATATNGIGVWGGASTLSGFSTGVWGVAASGGGSGVYGQNTSASGMGVGVQGNTASSDGVGVLGEAGTYTATNYGVQGIGGHGVLGAGKAGGAVYGVRGDAQGGGTAAAGVVGQYLSATVPTGQPAGVGVIGVNSSTNGWAMQAVASGGGGRGLVVEANSVGVSITANAVAIYGRANSTGPAADFGNLGSGTGLSAQTSNSGYYGVFGLNTATTGDAVAVRGSSSSSVGKGVVGNAGTFPALPAVAIGTVGGTSSATGYGLYGVASAATGVNYGVYGTSNSTSGRGVYGEVGAGTGVSFGVYGSSASTSGQGVFGEATAASGTTYGVYGSSSSASGRGVYGEGTHATGSNFGVYGTTASSSGIGVYARNTGGGTALYVQGNIRTNWGSTNFAGTSATLNSASGSVGFTSGGGTATLTINNSLVGTSTVVNLMVFKSSGNVPSYHVYTNPGVIQIVFSGTWSYSTADKINFVLIN